MVAALLIFLMPSHCIIDIDSIEYISQEKYFVHDSAWVKELKIEKTYYTQGYREFVCELI